MTDKVQGYYLVIGEFRKYIVVMSFNCCHTVHFSIPVIDSLGFQGGAIHYNMCNGL
jgi:predicted nucleic acid-binding Zn finger protein